MAFVAIVEEEDREDADAALANRKTDVLLLHGEMLPVQGHMRSTFRNRLVPLSCNEQEGEREEEEGIDK